MENLSLPALRGKLQSTCGSTFSTCRQATERPIRHNLRNSYVLRHCRQAHDLRASRQSYKLPWAESAYSALHIHSGHSCSNGSTSSIPRYTPLGMRLAIIIMDLALGKISLGSDLWRGPLQNARERPLLANLPQTAGQLPSIPLCLQPSPLINHHLVLYCRGQRNLSRGEFPFPRSRLLHPKMFTLTENASRKRIGSKTFSSLPALLPKPLYMSGLGAALHLCVPPAHGSDWQRLHLTLAANVFHRFPTIIFLFSHTKFLCLFLQRMAPGRRTHKCL